MRVEIRRVVKAARSPESSAAVKTAGQVGTDGSREMAMRRISSWLQSRRGSRRPAQPRARPVRALWSRFTAQGTGAVRRLESHFNARGAGPSAGSRALSPEEPDRAPFVVLRRPKSRRARPSISGCACVGARRRRSQMRPEMTTCG